MTTQQAKACSQELLRPEFRLLQVKVCSQEFIETTLWGVYL